MKVLHIYRTYCPDPPGGMQEAIRQICLSTQPLGVENTVFALSPQPWPKQLQRSEALVVRSRSWAAPASCDLGALDAVRTIRQLAAQADVLHYLFPWPFADALRLFTPSKPTVLTYVSDIVRQRWLSALYGPLMRHTLRSMNAIVYNAPAYLAGSTALSAAELQGRLHHIPLGMADASIAPAPDAGVLDRLGLGVQQPFVLFLGALRYYKGLHTLLQACAQIQAPVMLAGSGPMQHSLQAQARQLGLRNLLWVGGVTDAEKLALLQACRCLVLPSHLRSEAYGMVLIEASMCAKPMVSCEIGTGTSYINQHGETGWVVPPEQPAQLAAALNTLLQQPELATRMGQAARARYLKHFSAAPLGQAYAALFRQVAQAPAPPGGLPQPG